MPTLQRRRRPMGACDQGLMREKARLSVMPRVKCHAIDTTVDLERQRCVLACRYRHSQ
jgi:hypothetical protein